MMQSGSSWIVIGSLLLALGLVTFRALWMSKSIEEFDLQWRMGPGGWDYSSAWASTLTLVGAFFGAILVPSGAVPEGTHYLPRDAYSTLSVLFGMLTVLAPFLYRALSTVESRRDKSAPEPLQYQGFVWSFLLASILTVWSVIGAMATAGVFLLELNSGGKLLLAAFVLLESLLAVTTILVIIYAWRSLFWTVSYQADRDTRAKVRGLEAKILGVKLADDQEPKLDTPLPRWSVL